MRVIVLGVNSFNSKAGKPCFQAYTSMPSGNGGGFSPSITCWLEPLEYQALAKCVPCHCEAEQKIDVNRDGRTEVKFSNYRDFVPCMQGEKTGTAKAS